MFVVKDEEIEKLIEEEKENALKYGKFHSDHEFYGVVKEEIEEAEEEVNKLAPQLNNVWDKIKDDDDSYMDIAVSYLKTYSFFAIRELLQVCAVCDKYLENLKF